MPVVITGSISLDTVETSTEEHTEFLGGSATYVFIGEAALKRLADEGSLVKAASANLHPVSARVDGTVAEVLTDDNRPARLGEPLLRLDPRDFEVVLDEARSNGLSAEAAVPQAEAQVGQAHAQLDQAEAGIAQTKAQLDKATLDLRRADELIKKNVSTQSENDTAKANHEAAVANAASAHATMLRAAEASLQVTAAKRGTAQASVRDAELQLFYATIRPRFAAHGRSARLLSSEINHRLQTCPPPTSHYKAR